MKENLATKPLEEGLVFGVDVGIASCGWAVVAPDKIVAIGSHNFEAAEDPKTRKLKNQHRREKRGMRRVIRRRRARIAKIRELLEKNGICSDASAETLRNTLFCGEKPPFDVWETRVRGLSEQLSSPQIAAVLIHLAKHRGYFSNSKQERGENIAPESKKVLHSIDVRQDSMAQYRSYAEQILRHKKFQGRKRNRLEDYERMPLRAEMREEAKAIIEAQKSTSVSWATDQFIERYSRIAFDQLPIASGEELVGKCLFETEEKRSSRFAPTFEKFRLASKLAHETIEGTGASRKLRPDEIHKTLGCLGEKKNLTYKNIRKILKLEDFLRFASAPPNSDDKNDPESKDITGTTSGAGAGTYLLRETLKTLGNTLYQNVANKPFCLDEIADILTFNDGLELIEKRTREWQKKFALADSVADAIIKAAGMGTLNSLKGAAHISAKAASKILPFLEKGLVYSEACERAGYDHRRMKVEGELDKIPNAVVRRSLIRAKKQVEILIQTYGRPEHIHIEMTRDMGKSAKIRGEIERANNKRKNQKTKREIIFKEDIGRSIEERCSGTELLRYEMWREQKAQCLYCGRTLDVRTLQDTSTETQIDHIWPRSRFPDNSLVNKVLACLSCNQNKRGRTPWEWRGEADENWWQGFEARVRAMSCKKEKKRRLLSKTFADRLNEEGFLNRHKVDTSYIARRLLHELQIFYPESYREGMLLKGKSRHLYARPGALTAELRYAWTQSVWKKDREDDRHHAVDALVVALIDEGRLQVLTRHFQRQENSGASTHRLKKFDPPWENFAKDVKSALEGWYVSRTETRRVRGAGHEETIYRKRKGDERIMQRIAVGKLTLKQLERLPDKTTGNANTYDTLKAWLGQEKSKAGEKPLPTNKASKVIRGVWIEKDEKSTRSLDRQHMGEGQIKNASIVRTDVYYRVEEGYYIVPIYNYQILTKGVPTPNRASVYPKPEEQWEEMHREEYLFSLYRWSFVELVKRNGESIQGYFRGMNRYTASIQISPHHKKRSIQAGLGVRGLKSLKKFTVDRLGNKFEIKKESFPYTQINK